MHTLLESAENLTVNWSKVQLEINFKGLAWEVMLYCCMVYYCTRRDGFFFQSQQYRDWFSTLLLCNRMKWRKNLPFPQFCFYVNCASQKGLLHFLRIGRLHRHFMRLFEVKTVHLVFSWDVQALRVVTVKYNVASRFFSGLQWGQDGISDQSHKIFPFCISEEESNGKRTT